MNVSIYSTYEKDGGVFEETGYMVYDNDAEPGVRRTFCVSLDEVFAQLTEISQREPEDQ